MRDISTLKNTIQWMMILLVSVRLTFEMYEKPMVCVCQIVAIDLYVTRLSVGASLLYVIRFCTYLPMLKTRHKMMGKIARN